jgi:hypothetical protein
MGGFEFAMFRALFCDLNFASVLRELSIYFLLAVRADTFGFAHINHPSTASTINAKGSRIMDIVTIRSYFRMF